MKLTYQKTLGELPDVPAPFYSRIKSTLYRVRANELPSLPKSPQGIKLTAQPKNTKSGKRFFLKKDKNFGLLIFSTDKMLEALSNSKITLCDGTFKSAPKPFQQLFTIFGVKAGRKLPLIFAFMKRKTSWDYRRLFKYLKEKIFRLTGQPDWNPEFLLSDFEGGIRPAVESDFRETQHWGCHFTQLIYQKVHFLGPKKPYHTDPKLKKFVWRLLSVKVLPLQEMGPKMGQPCGMQATTQLHQKYQELQDLLRNFYNTWFVMHPPEIWNVFDCPESLRTDNSIESWNASWNKKIRRTKPNKWLAIRFL